MDIIMKKVKRKFYLRKLVVSMVTGSNAYYIMLGVVIFSFMQEVLYGVIFPVIDKNRTQDMNVDFAMKAFHYMSFGSVMATSSAYRLYRKFGRRQINRERIRRKGAVDSMQILAVLPIKKSEIKSYDFYRWFFGNVCLVLGVVVIQITAMKYGSGSQKACMFFLFPCYYLLCQTICWYSLLQEKLWVRIIYAISLVVFLLYHFDSGSKIFGNSFLKVEKWFHWMERWIGIPIVIGSILWLAALTILFHFFHRKNQVWME